MTIHKDLISRIAVSSSRWPQNFITELPNLLVLLVHNHQSLERLQLVSITVEQQTKATEAVYQRNKETVELHGYFSTSQQETFRCALRYFVRGQRQYYKPAIDDLAGVQNPLSTISVDDIKNFFDAIGQENDALYDLLLAKLAGRTDVQVPSQLLAFIAFDLAIDLLGKIERIGHRFSLTFLKSLRADEPINFVYKIHDDQLRILLQTPNGPVAFLEAI